MTIATTTAPECPGCGKKGKAVRALTLRALLKDQFIGQVAEADYRFCAAEECDVVYFGNNQTFTRPQLKVAVGVKETTGERPLCYCFGHSVAGIKEELQAKGRSDALEDIRRQMKDPGCRCEVTNPSGSCCLGSVARGIEIAKEEIGMGVSQKGQLDAAPHVSAGSGGELIAKIGTVISAIVASSCCWLPLVLLAVGISGVGIAATLEAYRPLFIAVTFGFLAAAFYFTYRPRAAATAAGQACCGPGTRLETNDCRARSGKRPFRMTTVNKVMLWVVALLAVAFLLFPKYVGFFLAGGNGAVEPNNPLVRTTAFTVEGMTCQGCSALVEKVIRDVPGVLSVKVDYDKKLATVATEECYPVPSDAIIDVLRKAGYRAAVAEQTSPAPTGTTDPKAGDCENGRCETPPAADKGKTDARPIDPDRQILFAVTGFT